MAQTLGMALFGQAQSVTIGLRAATSAELAKPRTYAEILEAMVAKTGGKVDTIAAAAMGELIINVSQGEGQLQALTMARAANVAGKVLIDVAIPLDVARGFPPA